ncbi:MAG TPA: hypothetical protein VEQ59_18220, partial [Polyangiaceae bacterium]|nr:hypothetical protein [Polyangiaceae bacterium]
MRLGSALLGACFALGAATARAEEPPPKRAKPDYDGRGGTPQPPARKALWVPRVLLFPAYVVSEYLVRRPLAAAIT